MVVILFQVAMIQLLKYGIYVKDIFYLLFMDMKDHHCHRHFHHVETILLQEELILLLWFGRVILRKMIKNLLKILELNLVRMKNKPVVFLLHKVSPQLKDLAQKWDREQVRWNLKEMYHQQNRLEVYSNKELKTRILVKVQLEPVDNKLI